MFLENIGGLAIALLGAGLAVFFCFSDHLFQLID